MAFTMVEIVVVVVIMSIAALLAIPMLSSAGDSQVKSAANIVASDIEYAKNLAIGRQKNYSIVFDTAADSYEVRDSDNAVIEHPMTKKPYSITFSNDSRLSSVKINTADFDSTSTLYFDYLGTPYSGSLDPLKNAGVITLNADEFSLTVKVQPMTGYISIE